MHRGRVILSLLLLLFISLYITPKAFPQNIPDEEAVEEGHADDQESAQGVIPPPAAPVAEPPKTVVPGQAPQGIQQPVSPQQPSAAQPLAPQPRVLPPPVPLPPKPVPTVSFFFDDADVYEVIQTIFADVLKVNYIVDPQVKGRVNFRTITPVPKDDVLAIMEIVLRMNGIGFVEEAGLYRIVPLTDVPRELIYSQIGKAPEKVAIDMFNFKNLELKEAMPDIENALGLHLKGGTVRILPIYRLNSLVVVATSSEQLMYIKKWIQVFDDMFAVTRLQIFVYPLQNSKAAHIASLMQSIFSGGTAGTATTPAATPKTPTTRTTAPGTAAQPATAAGAEPRIGAAATVAGGGKFVSPETKVFADEITNSLIILATPADYAFIEQTIRQIDILPRQVVIEALVAEIKLTDDLSFGLAWSLKTNVNFSLKPFDNPVRLDGQMGQGASTITGENADTLSGSGFTFLATDSAGVVRARLEALAQEAKARVLASPHVIVLDNREARIQIGDQVPIATSETNVSGSTEIQRTIQYKDTGVIMKVKPQINEGGLVSLELSQEVSTYSLKKIFGSDQVVISKREATTNLVAQNGQTIVIGGLISEQTDKTKEGIPFLSKIPLLGYLFGAVTDKYERKELVILLTPHVIRNQDEARNITSDYLQRMKGVRADIDKDGFVKNLPEQDKTKAYQSEPFKELNLNTP